MRKLLFIALVHCFAVSCFANSRIFSESPAQLLIDALKDSGVANSYCIPSGYCQIYVTNVICQTEAKVNEIEVSCSLTDATGKTFTKNSNDIRNENPKLNQALSSLGYQTYFDKNTAFTKIEVIQCGSQQLGENATCLVID